MRFKCFLNIISFFLIVFFNQKGFSQFEVKENFLDQNVKKLIYSDPEQALSVTKLMLSKANVTDYEKAKINILIAKANKVKGDYSSSLNVLFEEKKYEKQTTEYDKLVIELEKIAILRELSFNKEVDKNVSILEKKHLNASDKKLQLFRNASIALEKAKIMLRKQDYSKGIEILKKELQNTTSNFQDLAIWYKITLGQLYLESRNYTNATAFFGDAIKNINALENKNKFAKIFAISGLAKVYFQEKEHAKAIQILTEANSYSIDLKNLYLQEMIAKQLNVNYLAVKDSQNYKLTNVNFIKIHTEIENLEQDAVNTVFNLISEEQVENYKKEELKYFKIVYIILALMLLFLMIFGGIWWNYFQRKKRLNEIINYLKVTRNNFINRITEKKEEIKKVFLPKETEQLLLIKLQKFESTKKYTNKDISLAVLAGQFDTNTKYLSEVINSNYHVNFNMYINKLRINYIVEKLKTDSNFINYKISYLAENCGFSSHSSFATVFKSITGISPVTFIDLLKTEKENLEDKDE